MKVILVLIEGCREVTDDFLFLRNTVSSTFLSLFDLPPRFLPHSFALFDIQNITFIYRYHITILRCFSMKEGGRFSTKELLPSADVKVTAALVAFGFSSPPHSRLFAV